MGDFDNFNPNEFVKKQREEQSKLDIQKFRLEQEYKNKYKPRKIQPKLTKKQKKEKNINSGMQKLKSILSGKAQNKQLFKSNKLSVVLPYQKGELILRQRSPFFNKEYAKEKNILSWD